MVSEYSSRGAAADPTTWPDLPAPLIAGIVAQLFQADPTATPAEVEAALGATRYRYTDGAAHRTVGGYPTSVDKGTGLGDVVAAASALAAPADAGTTTKGLEPTTPESRG